MAKPVEEWTVLEVIEAAASSAVEVVLTVHTTNPLGPGPLALSFKKMPLQAALIQLIGRIEVEE